MQDYLSREYDLWTSDTVQSIVLIIGTVAILYAFYWLVWFIWHFTRPSNLHIYNHSPGGSWALVTGASDGIGYSFADVLLERGFNVLLHGRNPSKLENIKQELAGQYPQRKVDVVVADASNLGDKDYLRVAETARNLSGELTMLVNNVGGSTPRPLHRGLWEIPHVDIDTILNVNARFPTHLTRELLPHLQTNGPAIILNCGSFAGLFGTPYLTTYSATKGYIHSLSLGLRYDLLAEGFDNVNVMGLIIGNVFTAGNPINLPFFTISSRACAAGCLDRIGSGEVLTWPHWRHALSIFSLYLMPGKYGRQAVVATMRKRKEDELKSL